MARLHVVGVGGVGAHIAGTKLAGQILALVVGQVGDDHIGPRGVQPAHGGRAQTARTADDDGGAPTDLHAVSLLARRTLELRE
jgi:hypothetical protein